MSVTFTKLFSSITESTVWCEPAHTRLVWITMLAMADKQGRVWASIPGLANRARVPLDDTEKALDTFLAPDKYSRTKDGDGRRIEAIDGGWRLLNYTKYRNMRDDETRAQQNRDAQARHRDKVSKGADSKPRSAQAEAEAERSTTFTALWAAYPKKVARKDAMKAFLKLKLANGDFERVLAALEVAKKSSQWTRDSGKFIPHAATWLNGRRFEDEGTQAPRQQWTP